MQVGLDPPAPRCFWRNPDDQSGFTLIELIVVLGILGIVVTITSLGYKHSTNRARMAVLYSDIRQTKIAAQRFEQDCGFYPLDVVRGVDPGLVEKYGWLDGGHSAAWEQVDSQGLLDTWGGPYLTEWRANPWGGLYEWDNYPPGFTYAGIEGGAVFLTLRPTAFGGTEGLPPMDFEQVLEQHGVDITTQKFMTVVLLGQYK